MSILQQSLVNNRKVVPVVVGIGIVVASALIYQIYFSKKDKRKILLEDPQAKYKIPLIEKEEISHDTKRYRFGLPSAEHVLGLPTGQHIQLMATINGEAVTRKYTPVSSDDDHGFVDLVVKVYFKNVHPKFPDGGKMSQHLESLKIGDTIEVRGPIGRILYLGNGKFSAKKLRSTSPTEHKVSKIVMMAGGTGITPMLQIIRKIIKDPNDKTKMCLLFANQTEKDILLRKELEEVAAKHPDRFKLWYTLDTPPDNWKYSSGFISDTMIKEHLFPPSNDTIVLMCGPPPMVKYACQQNLEKLNYDMDLCYAY